MEVHPNLAVPGSLSEFHGWANTYAIFNAVRDKATELLRTETTSGARTFRDLAPLVGDQRALAVVAGVIRDGSYGETPKRSEGFVLGVEVKPISERAHRRAARRAMTGDEKKEAYRNRQIAKKTKRRGF